MEKSKNKVDSSKNQQSNKPSTNQAMVSKPTPPQGRLIKEGWIPSKKK